MSALSDALMQLTQTAQSLTATTFVVREHLPGQHNQSTHGHSSGDRITAAGVPHSSIADLAPDAQAHIADRIEVLKQDYPQARLASIWGGKLPSPDRKEVRIATTSTLPDSPKLFEQMLPAVAAAGGKPGDFGITLNSAIWGPTGDWKKRTDANRRSGFKAGDTIDHEFGHVVQLTIEKTPAGKSAMAAFLQEHLPAMRKVSGYAPASDREAWAEAFSAQYAANPPPVAVALRAFAQQALQ